MAKRPGKQSPTSAPATRASPESWQPFAQFREVVASEDLVGQPPQSILVPTPATLSTRSSQADPAPSGHGAEPVNPEHGAPGWGAPSVPSTVVTPPSAQLRPPPPLPSGQLPSGQLPSAPLPAPLRSNPAPQPIGLSPFGGAATPSRNGEAVNGTSAAFGRTATLTRPGTLDTPRPLPIPWTTDRGGTGSTEPEIARASPDGSPATAVSEGRRAVKNATTLGSSLVFTTAIGFAVNLYYQARLGPAPAGRVAAAEGLAATTLVVMAFGLDTYARKEVALRPGHAKEFVPGTILARIVATVPFTAMVMAVLAAVGRPREVIILLALFAVVRILVQSNELLAACLHAVGSVRALSRQNLATKIVWGVAIVGFLMLGFGAYSIPMGWIVGESLKLLGLALRTSEELQIWSQMRSQRVRPVLRESVPFLSSSVVTALAMVLDVTMMQFLASDEEIGYYRFAQSLLLIVLILATVLPWVLLPMASKAVGRSHGEFVDVMRRSIGSVMALAVPLCVLLSLNADTVVNTVAPKFAPAITALRILSITVIGTYLTMVCATLLQASGRTWAGVRIGMLVVGVDAVLVLAFVRSGWHRFGEGGAGTTAALSILFAEVVGTVLYVRALGREAWDRSSVGTVARVLLATVPVVLLDRVLAAKGFSFVRGVADVLAYGLNLILLQVVDPSKLVAAVRANAGRANRTTATG